MATITIKNTNSVEDLKLKNWNTGLDAAAGKAAIVDADFPVIAGNGAVKFRFWETEQFETVAAGETKTLTVADLSPAEKAYYEGMNEVAGLEVTIA